ncbi:hypothetical protein [Alkaliphilus sp. B6464]|uniref:hypothetical protein n=1 Tax=Alkaliphilus sp. B6464 TaxID=2731219 RepID=UPI001BA6B132|nr:hypothetical protein [Alkaliphilus sp. B6464]QUH21888.1 hypothetical protein HYG84_18300 [Alkaliphilus sp. B6464]
MIEKDINIEHFLLDTEFIMAKDILPDWAVLKLKNQFLDDLFKILMTLGDYNSGISSCFYMDTEEQVLGFDMTEGIPKLFSSISNGILSSSIFLESSLHCECDPDETSFLVLDFGINQNKPFEHDSVTLAKRLVNKIMVSPSYIEDSLLHHTYMQEKNKECEEFNTCNIVIKENIEFTLSIRKSLLLRIYKEIKENMLENNQEFILQEFLKPLELIKQILPEADEQIALLIAEVKESLS